MKERRRFYCITLLLIALILYVLHLNNFSDPAPPSKLLSLSSACYTPYLEWWNNFSYPTHLLNINDYNTLINYDFYFDILKQGCSNATLVLVLISSAPKNFEKRSTIRRTWGRRRPSNAIELLFVLGKSGYNTIEEKILIESRTFNDIIQGNFMDSYKNLTYKHLTSFKYAIYHCPQAKYILKLDDDAFVNMPLLRNFLVNDLSPFGASNVLFCVVQNNADALRSYRSKWRVSFAQYPLRKYPRYCFGWMILYSPDVIFSLYKSIQNISDIFWIDDVYITGIIAEKVNVNHTDISDLVLFRNDRRNLIQNQTIAKNPFLFSLADDKNEMEILLKHVLSHNVPRTVFKKRIIDNAM